MVKLLDTRAPKAWRRFDAFLDIFFSVMVNSPDEVCSDKEDDYNTDSEAYKTGIEIYFMQNMIKHLGDFILQENSPYQRPG